MENGKNPQLDWDEHTSDVFQRLNARPAKDGRTPYEKFFGAPHMVPAVPHMLAYVKLEVPEPVSDYRIYDIGEHVLFFHPNKYHTKMELKAEKEAKKAARMAKKAEKKVCESRLLVSEEGPWG